MDKLVDIWLSREDICDSTNIVSADLIDVSSLFVLLVTGVATSLLIFLGERLWPRKNKQPRIRKTSKGFDNEQHENTRKALGFSNEPSYKHSSNITEEKETQQWGAL